MATGRQHALACAVVALASSAWQASIARAQTNETHAERVPSSSMGSSLVAEQLVRRAEEDERRKRFARALSRYHEAIELAPRYAPAYLGLARLREQMGDLDEARALYRSAAALPDGQPALAGLAQLEYSRGNLQASILHLQQAVARSGDPQLQVTLAARYTEIRLYSAALQIWRRLEHSARPPPDVKLQIAALQLLCGSLDPVLAGANSDDWVRRSLARLALRP